MGLGNSQISSDLNKSVDAVVSIPYELMEMLKIGGVIVIFGIGIVSIGFLISHAKGAPLPQIPKINLATPMGAIST